MQAERGKAHCLFVASLYSLQNCQQAGRSQCLQSNCFKMTKVRCHDSVLFQARLRVTEKWTLVDGEKLHKPAVSDGQWPGLSIRF